MSKYEFLKHWFNVKGYRFASAIQSLITIQLDDPDSSGMFKKVPNSVYIEDNQYKAVVNDQVVELGGDVKLPYVTMHEKFTFLKDFHPVLQNKQYLSTFGIMLINVGTMYEAFGTKVEYINGKWTPNVILPILSRLMVDNGDDIPEDKASVEDCLRFSTFTDFFRGLSIHFVKPGGVETLSANPKVEKRKEELLAKHKDQINDPLVFTKILEELVELDMKEMMEGDSKDFFISKSMITNNRKRMFGMFGVEPDTDNPGKFKAVTNSLDEGLDPEFLMEVYNEALVGIYSRGKLTAKGGAQVKDLTSLFGRIKIVEEDCGSKQGEILRLHKGNIKGWMGSWFMEGGKLVNITKDNANSLLGKPLNMRVPQYCKSKDGDKCKRCVGDSLGALAHRLGSEVVNIAQKFQLISMKQAHVSGADLVKLDLDIAIKI